MTETVSQYSSQDHLEQDNWRPSCSREALQQRARLYQIVRNFFHQRQVLEVETPLLSMATATDPFLASIRCQLSAQPGVPATMRYLHTSPEFPMKRLLASGSGDIFQIAKCFRDGERGRRHNPEFSMLEWYRVGFELNALMDEVETLLAQVMEFRSIGRRSYREVFLQYLQFDPFTISDIELRAKAAQLCEVSGPELGRDDFLNLLLSQYIEPQLGQDQPEFLTGYPPSQASLAKVEVVDGIKVAQRFELYCKGLELANGYFELTDASEQRRRLEADNEYRQTLGLDVIPLDENLLAALQSGLPSCAGVALGLDRLLMVMADASSIDEVISFPVERA